MANSEDKRITELDAAIGFNLTDLIPIADENDDNYAVTGQQVVDLVQSETSASDIPYSQGVSVKDKIDDVADDIPSFISHSAVLTLSGTRTVYTDVAIDSTKLILQGAILSADAAVPLVCSIQRLGANSSRLRVTAMQNYTSNVTLNYLEIS